jgi:hypothetical protein
MNETRKKTEKKKVYGHEISSLLLFLWVSCQKITAKRPRADEREEKEPDEPMCW